MNSVKLLTALLLVMTLGCSERYYNGKGHETLVYPETHVYQITAKSKQQTEAQLEQIFRRVDEIDSNPSITVEYRNNRAKGYAQNSIQYDPTLAYRAESFELKRNSSLTTDLKVTITYHTIVSKPCAPAQIEKDLSSINCFSESARNRHIANKESLLEGI
ncbi:hypothetical protein [Vibrio hippocampi]|uniref:Lipoprotein n=1 Tax=Vibrio hippocampi TaxID=654686 RepID=A0ABM8ZMP6_9VIBR|nr:hypothetical protein [Vibrio hippocampi]CAH0529495.1 hypothetical protein VHP8226_03249 [Vibrio hippocampi]